MSGRVGEWASGTWISKWVNGTWRTEWMSGRRTFKIISWMSGGMYGYKWMTDCGWGGWVAARMTAWVRRSVCQHVWTSTGLDSENMKIHDVSCRVKSVCPIGQFHAGVEHVSHYVCYSCANEGWLRKHAAASSSRNQQTCTCCRNVFTQCFPVTIQGIYLCFLVRATNQPAIPWVYQMIG